MELLLFTINFVLLFNFAQYTDSHYRSSLIDALASTVTPGVSVVTTTRHVHVSIWFLDRFTDAGGYIATLTNDDTEYT